MEDTYKIFNKDYENKPSNYYGNSRPEVLALVPENCKNFLDVGCSNGSFGNLVKQKRKESVVWGIEPHKSSFDQAEKKLDKVINSYFTADLPEIQGKKFDCISFNDVLEHVFDPKEVLGICKNFLTQDGYVVASIPNILFFHVFFEHIILKKDWQYTDGGTLDETHVKFFTPKSVKRLFETAGYDIVRMEGLNKTASMKFKIFNLMTFGYFKEWRPLQIGVVAKVRK